MFELVSEYSPSGDQPDAIRQLVQGFRKGKHQQVLLGVTGSGKTFTVANVIRELRKPTLVISHNKTLAAQLYAEFKSFFPNNAVEYFVSYFDYYQPEAYIPRTDTYIEKDSSINAEIERLRLSAMSSLFSREDVVVVASVSCIYGIGSREDYESMLVTMRIGQEMSREDLLLKLVELQYERNDTALMRGHFRVRGDVVELVQASMDDGLRIEFFGDEIDRLTRFEPLTGTALEEYSFVTIYPGKQFVSPKEKMKKAIKSIRAELEERVAEFESQGKLLEAQRIRMRTEFDLEMMDEMGFCSGIENYSRHIGGRPPGATPATLLDFFPDDFLLVIDESHVSVPQIGGMYAGDRSRKTVLVEHGFRLPSALDNRPLNFDEFQKRQRMTLYVSATPAQQEIDWSEGAVAEQIVRPTGLVDPEVEIKPLESQIDDLIEQARLRVEAGERVFVTTLTKRTAEELTDYLRDVGIQVRYLHSEIDAIERVEILRALRRGEFDVLVGINLLREGLDVPEVSLVAILDADKEGYLRSTTSLIQTAGRAARHIHGKVILYADRMTHSIREFLKVTAYRREKQLAYNREHGITPQPVRRSIEEKLSGNDSKTRDKAAMVINDSGGDFDITETLRTLEAEMLEASQKLEFEKAALIRDQILELKKASGEDVGSSPSETRSAPRSRAGRKLTYRKKAKSGTGSSSRGRKKG